MPVFDVSRIELPDFGVAEGGCGSELVPVGDAAKIVLSLPSGGATCPWACVDVRSGEVSAARGLRGEVRDGRLTGAGRGWLLTGVCPWPGQALTVVDVRTSAIVRKIRVPGPDLSVVSEQAVTLYAPPGGQRMLLRRSDLERLEVAAMPYGTRPWFDNGELVLVACRCRPAPASGMRSHASLRAQQTMVMIDSTRRRQLIVARW